MFGLRLSAIARITIGLTGLLISMLGLVTLLGLFPNPQKRIVPLRAGICETAAIGFSLLADQKDTVAMQRYLESIVERNSEIVSMGARLDDGTLLINVGDHDVQLGLFPASRLGPDPSLCAVVCQWQAVGDGGGVLYTRAGREPGRRSHIARGGPWRCHGDPVPGRLLLLSAGRA